MRRFYFHGIVVRSQVKKYCPDCHTWFEPDYSGERRCFYCAEVRNLIKSAKFRKAGDAIIAGAIVCALGYALYQSVLVVLL